MQCLVLPTERCKKLFETPHDRGIKLALGSPSNQDEVKYYTALLGAGSW